MIPVFHLIYLCILSPFSGLLVVHFWAPWATQCEVMNTAMTELAKTNLQVNFAEVSLPQRGEHCNDRIS